MPQLVKIIPTQQLQPIDLVAPGFRGLNLSQSGGILPPVYCTEATNAVIDDQGRLAARQGVTTQTSTPIDPAVPIKTLFVYRETDGDTQTIVAYDGGISNSIADPEGNDISGTVTDTDGNWWFVNFNGKAIGFQDGLIPIVYTGVGNFAEITESSGTAPSGSIGLAAFGRVWGVDSDRQTIKYSALLDETDWGGAGAGSIDMRNIWTQGMDVITALWEYNNRLVVFGKRHIVFMTEPNATDVGLDPTALVLEDVISGTGCESQWTIQAIGETDLLFYSSHGVQSLQRVVQERSNPVSTLSKYVRSDLLETVRASNPENLRSTYNSLRGFYLLSSPTAGWTWVLDQTRKYVDEQGDLLAPVTRWNIAPTALLSLDNSDLLMTITSGEVGEYGGTSDDGEDIMFIFQSPWLNLGEELANRLKILKRLGAILFVRNNTTLTYKWSVDFNEEFQFIQRTLQGETSAEFGSAEFGEDEFSGGIALRILKLPARKKGTGQYFRIGIEAIANGDFGLLQAEILAKIGRLA